MHYENYDVIKEKALHSKTKYALNFGENFQLAFRADNVLVESAAKALYGRHFGVRITRRSVRQATVLDRLQC